VSYLLTVPCPCSTEAAPRWSHVYSQANWAHEDTKEGAHIVWLENPDPYVGVYEYRSCPGDVTLSEESN